MYLTRDFARLREWFARHHEEPKAWRDAAVLMGPMLLLTPDELVALTARVTELMEPYRRRERMEDAPADARPVAVHYAAFPVD